MPEGSLRQKRGLTYRYAPYLSGRGQADEAGGGRDESATQDKVLYPSNG